MLKMCFFISLDILESFPHLKLHMVAVMMTVSIYLRRKALDEKDYDHNVNHDEWWNGIINYIDHNGENVW